MRRNWIKLYVDQTLRGTCFEELLPDERFIWFGFLLLAGDNAIEGKICITNNIGYIENQLAELLKCDIELIKRSIKKMIKFNKIKVLDGNVIQIVNWEKYQSEYQRQRDYREEYKKKLQREVTAESAVQKEIEIEKEKKSNNKNILSSKEELDHLVEKIVGYLNQKAGCNFSPKSDSTQKLISGRLTEGRSWEDFQKVIDCKVSQWKDNPEMAKYLRPKTLFNKTNFENYLNEPEVKKQGFQPPPPLPWEKENG